MSSLTTFPGGYAAAAAPGSNLGSQFLQDVQSADWDVLPPSRERRGAVSGSGLFMDAALAAALVVDGDGLYEELVTKRSAFYPCGSALQYANVGFEDLPAAAFRPFSANLQPGSKNLAIQSFLPASTEGRNRKDFSRVRKASHIDQDGMGMAQAGKFRRLSDWVVGPGPFETEPRPYAVAVRAEPDERSFQMYWSAGEIPRVSNAASSNMVQTHGFLRLSSHDAGPFKAGDAVLSAHECWPVGAIPGTVDAASGQDGPFPESYFSAAALVAFQEDQGTEEGMDTDGDDASGDDLFGPFAELENKRTFS